MSLKFSFIIPIHHEYYTIEHCLNSIFSQSYKNFEIICVLDNASNYVETALQKYNVQQYKCSFNNPGLARNLGLQYASGDYIGFVDSDDYLVADNILEELNKHLTPDIDELIGNYNIGDGAVDSADKIGTRVYNHQFLIKNNLVVESNGGTELAVLLQTIKKIPHNCKYINNLQPYYYYSFLPGSMRGNRKYKNALWFCFSGCGKTYASQHSTHGWDLESCIFKKNNVLYVLAMFIMQEIHSNQHGILMNIDLELIDLLKAGNVPINIIMPSYEMKEEILSRIKNRDGATSPGLKELTEQYDNLYNQYTNQQNINIYFLQPGQYIYDILPQLDKMNAEMGLV